MAVPEVVVFPGQDAFSVSKVNDSTRILQAESITATFYYLVALHHDCSIRNTAVAQGLDLHQLSRLLSSGGAISPNSSTLDPSLLELFVAPRTLSPWSSKATNIAQVCGFGPWVKRIERITVVRILSHREVDHAKAFDLFHDRMTQTISLEWPDMGKLFEDVAPSPAKVIRLKAHSLSAQDVLQATNKELGLALDKSEIDYLTAAFGEEGSLARDPSDVELFMFAQVWRRSKDPPSKILMALGQL